VRLYYFTDIPGWPIAAQQELAKRSGYAGDASPAWADTKSSYPEQRTRMLRTMRPNQGDEIWVAVLPVLAKNRHELRAVLADLAKAGASILEGSTGWKSLAPHEPQLMAINALDYFAKGSRGFADPAASGRKGGKASGEKARNARMPDSLARAFWLDPTIVSDADAVTRMNSDPRFHREWTKITAYRKFGKSGRPPGRRPLPLPTDETDAE